MLAFAGNSLLCRLALRDGHVDAVSFTVLRLVSGALALLLIVALSRARERRRDHNGSWLSALMLLAYALLFSLAYLDLDAATGALILFGCVQATMIASALLKGERPGTLEWSGWVLAAAGLLLLTLPGSTAPSLAAALTMGLAGIAWGLYSLRGRDEPEPFLATAGNFSRSALLVLPVGLLFLSTAELSMTGALLAVISGALTSGVGYVLWYAALAWLGAMQAALVQLSVPALTALGGVMLLSESMTLRLAASGAMTLAGIGLALWRKTAGHR